jgi:hypothetical protein
MFTETDAEFTNFDREIDSYERDQSNIILALWVLVIILGCALVYFVVGPLLWELAAINNTV